MGLAECATPPEEPLGVLAELFPIWGTRNGSRAPELNAPAILAADLRGLAGSGASDDHAGIDVHPADFELRLPRRHDAQSYSVSADLRASEGPLRCWP